MSKEYIEKDAAINAIEDTSCYLCKKYIGTKKCDCDCEIWRNKKMLHGIPPADVRPVVRGEWIMWNYPANEHTRCSVCGTEYDQMDLYIGGSEYPNFCPNCGAEMTEEAVRMLRERSGENG